MLFSGKRNAKIKVVLRSSLYCLHILGIVLHRLPFVHGPKIELGATAHQQIDRVAVTAVSCCGDRTAPIATVTSP